MIHAKKIINSYIISLCLLLVTSQSLWAQKNTLASGNWGSFLNWSGLSVPTSTDVVNVNHSMNLNTGITIASGGYYTFNQSSSASNALLTMTGGTLEVTNNSTVSFTNTGTFGLSGGTIIVRSGSTLNIGSGSADINLSGVNILVESGATLNLIGNVNRTSSTGTIQIDGTMNVTRRFFNSATGTMTVNGSASFNTTSSTIFTPSSTVAIQSSASSFTISGTGTVTGTGNLLMRDTGTTELTLNVASASFSGNLANYNTNPTLNFYNTVTLGGYAMTNNGTVNVKTGANFTINSGFTTNASGLRFFIEPDAYMAVNGNMTMQNGGTLQIDGELRVNGNFMGQDTNVTGTGEFTTSGSMATTNSKTIFGNNFTSPNDCGGPECDARKRCNRTSTVTSSSGSSMCSGSSSTLSVSYTPSSFTTQSFQWQSRLSGGTYSDVSGQTNTTYAVSPTATTIYRVKMTVNGCTFYSSGFTMTIVAAPTVPTGVTGSISICSGNTTMLTATGGTGTGYAWYTASSGGTLLSSSAVYTTPTLTSNATYYVERTSGSCISSTRYVVSVTVNSLPSAPSANDVSRCGWGTVTLTASGSPASYKWYNSSGTFITGETNASYTTGFLMVPTNYSVSSVSAAGCESITRTTVTANVVTIIGSTTASSNSPVCTGQTINLSTPTVSGASYSWSGPGGFSSSTQNPSIASATAAMAGTYTVTVTFSVCAIFASTTVTVNTTPAVPTAGSNSPLCEGSTINLTASTVSGASYSWTGPNSFSSTAQNPSISTATTGMSGTYSVTATANGCTSTAGTVSVTVNSIPSAPTAGSNSPVCTSDASIDLTASTVSGATYSWTGPASFTSSLQNPSRSPVTVAKGGTYSVTVTVNGCTSAASTITVTVNTTPSAPTAGSNSPVYEEATINLTASNVSGATYSWTGPNSFTSSTQNPSISSATTAMGGTYSVTATTNGCTSTAGTVTVVVNPLTFMWTGNSNSVWNNTGNWSSAMVPTSTRTVTIPTGRTNYPNLVGETADINNMTVQSGGSVTLGNNSSLTVRGDINNSGTVTGTTGSTVVFTGSSNGTVTGTTTLHNVILNKTSGVSVTLSNSSTVNGAINLTSGELKSNGNLILNLDNGYINKGGAGSITGNMTVTRTVSSIRTHYFSVPLDGATVADLSDDVSVFNTVNGVSRLFQYSESTNAWTRITSGTAPLIKGIGYSLYFTTPTVLDITGTYDHSYVHNVTFTNTANAWKFVGNPYPSTIDWDAASGWTKTNLNNAVNYWEGSSGQYISYVSGVGTTAGGKTADQYIPAMNGFWVQTTGTGGATSTLNMTSNVRSSVPMTLYRDIDMSNVYSLTISNGTVTDEAIIRFNDGSDPSFESEIDANKLINTGSIPSVASTMLGSTMSINTMPVPTTATEIPLYVKVASNGNYTLTWSNKVNPLYGAQLFLYDKKLGTSTAVMEDVAYTITQSTSDSTNRYVLKLVPSIPVPPTTPPQSLTTSTQSALESSVRVYARDGKVYVEGIGSVTREVEGEIITVGGTPLDHFTGEIGEGVVISRTLSQVSSSMYLVRITSNGQQATYRVVMY